jgi:hypothetical protein
VLVCYALIKSLYLLARLIKAVIRDVIEMCKRPSVLRVQLNRCEVAAAWARSLNNGPQQI